jgi:DNA-binding transcriptional ArsR family regulator
VPRSELRQRRHETARTAPVFAALGDETRLDIVARLSSQGPLSISRLTEDTSITRQAITKHLKVLKGAGLVKDTRAGRERLFRLESARLEQAKRHLDAISLEWDRAIDRLRALVEE